MENLLSYITVPGWLFLSICLGCIVLGIWLISLLFTNTKLKDSVSYWERRNKAVNTDLETEKANNKEFRKEIQRKESLLVACQEKVAIAKKPTVRRSAKPKPGADTAPQA